MISTLLSLAFNKNSLMTATKCLVILVFVGFCLLSGCGRRSQNAGDLQIKQALPDVASRDLAFAAAEGNIREIDRLLSNGVTVDAKGINGVTPLWWAIWADETGVRHLLERGANPNIHPDGYPSSMEVAAWNRSSRILQLLIAHGGNVNLASKDGFRHVPLHGANIGKSISNTKLLIEKHADLEVTDSLGRTPFLHACMLFNYDQAILLLEAGAKFSTTAKAHDGLITVWTELDRGERRLRKGSPADMDRQRLAKLLEERGARRLD
jgi:ankyrin repeat protein